MRKIRIYIIFFYIFFLFYNLHAEKNYSIESLKIFLEEYVDNKKTGDFLLIDLLLYKDVRSDKIKWKVTQQWFEINDYTKTVKVSLAQSRSKDDFNTPLIEKLYWEPWNIISCIYQAWGGNSFELKAKKVSNNDWEVIGIGKFKTCDSCKPKDWKLIGVKKIKLKYKDLEIEE